MALVLGAFVVWSLFVAPALATLRSAPAQLESLDAQLLEMRGMAAEVRELRNATPIAAAQAGLAIKAAAERLGDKVRLSLQNDRALLTPAGRQSRAAARVVGRGAQRGAGAGRSKRS